MVGVYYHCIRHCYLLYEEQEGGMPASGSENYLAKRQEKKTKKRRTIAMQPHVFHDASLHEGGCLGAF